ncbi:MAG: diacylglycerol kinase family protein [Haloplanus sp.]
MHRVVIRNPASGNWSRSLRAVQLARARGYEVRDTTAPGDAVEMARAAAAEGATRIVACGGDGTVNEVVWGVDEAGRTGDVELGVVPTGTGNGFAEDVGVFGVRQAFEVLDRGETRRLDLGMAGSRPFLKTCVAGFPAGVSAHTTAAMKRALGVAAYGLGAVPYALDALTESDVEVFSDLSVRVGPASDPLWAGTALLVLVGNSRQFPGLVWRQAPLEDGLLEVVVVKRAAAFRGVRRTDDATHRFETPHLLRVRSRELFVDAPRTLFSVDGEIQERASLDVGIRPRALRFRVGARYRP